MLYMYMIVNSEQQMHIQSSKEFTNWSQTYDTFLL